jgi:hypothetical protein
MTDLGPVQLIAFGFGPEANFEGRVLAELRALEEQETIRLLDLLFVRKDPDTEELMALDVERQDLGAIVGALLGFDFDMEPSPSDGEQQIESHAFGLTRADILALGAAVRPGYAGGFLLIEHVWARKLKRAIGDAGGVPLGEGFLTPDAMAAVAQELAAMAQAFEELEQPNAHAAS